MRKIWNILLRYANASYIARKKAPDCCNLCAPYVLGKWGIIAGEKGRSATQALKHNWKARCLLRNPFA